LSRTLLSVTEDLSRAVAGEVRRLLDERGISGRQLAERAGIPQRTVANKLSGRNPFDLDDVAKVCAVLEVDVTDLLAWAQRN
jgi:transcriptional regulator with XRE-family HTH domain